MSEPIYLDYAATTPVDEGVIARMLECLGEGGAFANPASATHEPGRRAAALVERARAQVAALIGAAPEEIVFTSGATESDNLAILGAAEALAPEKRHFVSCRTEHKAVLDPLRALERRGARITWLATDDQGRIDPAALRAALRPDTALVSLMHVNNETGLVQDLDALGAVCREANVLLHSDAAQSAGRLPIDVRALPVDLLSLSAHKLYGPKGVGALWVRPTARPFLRPLLYGGGQERGLRSGTLPTHQIVGFGAAAELAGKRRDAEERRQLALRERLWQALAAALPDVWQNAGGAPRVGGILNVSFGGVEGESLFTGLPGLAVATGSACTSATQQPSHVLRALGRDPQLSQSSLRFSLGRSTTEAEVDRAAGQVIDTVRRLRALAPLADPPPVGGVEGRAGRRVDGVEVQFRLRPGADGRIAEASWRAYGCPHTLAVMEDLGAALRGRRPADGPPGAPADWLRRHAVPVEKLGRLLVIEDALRAALQAAQQARM